MKNDLNSHHSPDIFRIILVLAGILLSVLILITQIRIINLSTSLIFVTLGIAGSGALISALTAKRISVRIGKEPLASIFVSFSYSDTKFVDRLTYELSQRGFNVLRADHALLAGDIISDKITQLLHEADFFIVVISNKSLQSENVLNETVVFKEDMGRRIIPVLIEKTEQPGQLAGVLDGIQFVNFITSFDDGLKRLIYSLEENTTKFRNKQG